MGKALFQNFGFVCQTTGIQGSGLLGGVDADAMLKEGGVSAHWTSCFDWSRFGFINFEKEFAADSLQTGGRSPLPAVRFWAAGTGMGTGLRMSSANNP